MGKPSIHVMSNPKGGWDVKRSGADRASSHHDTKTPAVDHGRDLAKKDSTELFIHGKDNKIQDRDSYGNDPFPPRDTKH